MNSPDAPNPHAAGYPTQPTAAKIAETAEGIRLEKEERREANWKRWGPYLAERQWGTVREDYSANGDSWNHFAHDHARSQAYRWGEDGLLGITDRQGRICFSIALWNHQDPFLKERLFGLTGPQGNHGEDVKEEYFYLDSTPTHSYMKALYKYPQAEFPYQQLIDENAKRSKLDSEFELRDTGTFDESRYFDVTAEYAKAGPDDILIKITIANRGPEAAVIDCLPTLWCRNTWAHGRASEGYWPRPRIERESASKVTVEHASIGNFEWLIDSDPDGNAPPLLFTENETNRSRLYGVENEHPYVKDAFHEYVVHGKHSATHPGQVGTKSAAHYRLNIEAGQSVTLRLRLRACDKKSATSESETDFGNEANALGADFEQVFTVRKQEADEFYAPVLDDLKGESRSIARQAYAGLLWTKQFYYYNVRDWMRGDPESPCPAGVAAQRAEF